MAKTDNTTVEVETAAPAAPDSFELTLDEFCIRLSKEVSAPELIGAFHYTEKAAGRHKDFEAAYRKRYAAFAELPA